MDKTIDKKRRDYKAIVAEVNNEGQDFDAKSRTDIGSKHCRRLWDAPIYMHMCVCAYLKRADGRGCECTRSANDSTQSVVEKVWNPKQTPVWATCALANTVLIGHRYNSTC